MIEIEKKIGRRDFLDLFSISSNVHDKTRYDLVYKQDGKKNVWEVDFFKDPSFKNGTYFVMAEHEMPELQLTPDFMPDIISKYLVYEVSINDCRFASRKIANPLYAEGLYLKIDLEEIRRS